LNLSHGLDTFAASTQQEKTRVEAWRAREKAYELGLQALKRKADEHNANRTAIEHEGKAISNDLGAISNRITAITNELTALQSPQYDELHYNLCPYHQPFSKCGHDGILAQPDLKQQWRSYKQAQRGRLEAERAVLEGRMNALRGRQAAWQANH